MFSNVQPLTVTKLLVEAVLAVIALAGIVASSPLLVSKARLIRERNEASTEASSLRSAVGAFEIGLRALDHLREEVQEIRAVQIISTRYVVDLIAHIRDGGSAETMPMIPVELRDDVLAMLRARPHAARAATATDPPA
ncbi:MAG TPA: hypothetical protein VGC72_15045 [Candidatus Elarobacter sp.]|jgi:hypothetical protein